MQWLMGALGVRTSYELIWVGLGLGGQLMFMIRFIVQWIVSERARRSVIPVSFWWFSIAGAAILLAYAIHRRDPVFILGQSLGFFVYLRNLWLIRAEHRPRRSRSERWQVRRLPGRAGRRAGQRSAAADSSDPASSK